MRTAIVHDWLTGMRGGEKCLEVFCELFPDATLFTLIHNKGSVSPVIENMDIRTSFLQKIPGITKRYRNFIPLFPLAVEMFDLSGYDLVLSSSHCVAKGVKTPSQALNICYCYTPVRYAWKFFDQYFSRERPFKKVFIRAVMKSIREWDLASNKRIDYFIAISDNVKTRIEEFYGRTADVIYPPVDTGGHTDSCTDEGFYLVVSALVPYKKIDLAIKAFNASGRKLVIIGDGSDTSYLRSMAGENIALKGWAAPEELSDYFSRCRALVFPGEEDFGIVPVEAQAHGKPVIAYGAGGVLETVTPLGGMMGKAPTGVFFVEQTEVALNRAIDIFEDNISSFDHLSIRENALRFNRSRFKEEIGAYINDKLAGV